MNNMFLKKHRYFIPGVFFIVFLISPLIATADPTTPDIVQTPDRPFVYDKSVEEAGEIYFTPAPPPRVATSSLAATQPEVLSQAPAFSTITFATDTPGLPPLIIPASLSSPETAASDTIMFLDFFNKRIDKCMSGDISMENLDSLMKAYMDIENTALQRIVVDTVECLAISENDPMVCDKFKLFPDEVKEVTPYETLISACVSRLNDFRMYEDSFSTPGNCKKTLQKYCENRKMCNNQPPGKVCTCQLYSTVWCGVTERDKAENCETIKDDVREVLKGTVSDNTLIEKYADNAALICRKAVLGFNPRLDVNDDGASQILFLGGLFSGADWAIFQEGGDLSGFGVSSTYSQWYYTVYREKRSCLVVLGAFKKEFCYIAAKDGAEQDYAHAKEGQKKVAEEVEKQKQAAEEKEKKSEEKEEEK